jgi:hypothetical protein
VARLAEGTGELIGGAVPAQQTGRGATGPAILTDPQDEFWQAADLPDRVVLQ